MADWMNVSFVFIIFSNIAFLCPAYRALMQKKPYLAMVYCFTMVMSIAYHLQADFDFLKKYLPYEGLIYGDYVASNLAMWSTAIEIANPKYQAAWRAAVMLYGFYLVPYLVRLDPTAIPTMIMPLTIALFYTLTSWIYRYRVLREQQLRHYLIYVVGPSSIHAIIGFVNFIWVEDESNRWLIHSYWHVCMAWAAFVLLKQPETPIEYRDLE